MNVSYEVDDEGLDEVSFTDLQYTTTGASLLILTSNLDIMIVSDDENGV